MIIIDEKVQTKQEEKMRARRRQDGSITGVVVGFLVLLGFFTTYKAVEEQYEYHARMDRMDNNIGVLQKNDNEICQTLNNLVAALVYSGVLRSSNDIIVCKETY